MNIIRYPERESWPALLKRPELNHSKLEEQVQQIIEDVANKRRCMLYSPIPESLTRWNLDQLEVPREEMKDSR